MGIVEYIVLVLVVGIAVTLIVNFVPDNILAPQFKKLIVTAAVIILLVILLLALFGGVGDRPIPHLFR